MAEKEIKVTAGRQVILRELDGQSRKWSELRAAYYGPERAKSKASTSFHTQVTKLMALGVVAKANDLYSLTPMGVELLSRVKESGANLGDAKSNACLQFVPKVVETQPEA
jgi:predicted transcriptional regulator